MTEPVRADLIAHLRQQIDQDPEAFLRGRLPCATAILVSKLTKEAK